MRRNWKRTTCLFIGAALLIGLVGLISSQSGSRAIAHDPPSGFETALDINGSPFEALKDRDTGLMWGKEFDHGTLIFYIDDDVTSWANAENAKGDASLAGGYPGYDEDNPDGWRPATVGEILEAHDHGLLTYLDFSYNSYSQDGGVTWEDVQSWDDPLPVNALVRDADGKDVKDDNGEPIRYTDPYYHYTDRYLDPYIDPADPIDTWGEKWYSSCTFMQGGRHYRHTVRFGDGTSKLHLWPFPVIPVRGAPPNHDGCPKVKGSDIPDIPGKNKLPKPPKK